MDVGSTTVKEEQFVRLDVEQCYDEFLELIWRQGGSLGVPQILEEGDPRSGRGCARRVGLFIVERVVEAERGQFLEYTIEKPWPTSYNRARVSFQDVEGNTVITWTSNFTPFPCCGWLRFVVSWAFRQLLADLAEAAKEKTEPR
ncbi:unnamed protein product [Cladocopium goreaui]|uniref:Aurora kinase n=1 Tax=Cladocopium goreaui TaxID=2562237 RepID=A0A9P1DQW7_9DINO|nr:unnamed protein product [Cladocopium goreaui]